MRVSRLQQIIVPFARCLGMLRGLPSFTVGTYVNFILDDEGIDAEPVTESEESRYSLGAMEVLDSAGRCSKL